MGYSTNYRLSTFRTGEKSSIIDVDDLIEDLQIVSDYTHFDPDGDDVLLYDAKWYDHEQNMRTISELPKYEDILFELYGEGEEAGDIWKMYIRNGNVQRVTAQIVFPPADLDKL